MAEGDRVVDATRRSSSSPTRSPRSDGIASGIGTTQLRRPARRRGRRPATRRSSWRWRSSRGPRRRPACRRGRSRGSRRSARTTTRRRRGDRMIRLGSLAGLPVRGPARAGRLDAAGRAPRSTRSSYKPEPETKPEQYAVIYVGHSDDLSAERFPFKPPAGAVLGASGRQPVEGLHLHLRGARRPALAPRADRPGADRDLPPELQRPAVRPGVEGRVDRRVHTRRPPARSPPAATRDRELGPLRRDRPARRPGAGARPDRRASSRRRRAAGTGGARTRAGPARARPVLPGS